MIAQSRSRSFKTAVIFVSGAALIVVYISLCVSSPSSSSSGVSQTESAGALPGHRREGSEEAYVTLLYGSFFLPMRVLGLSLQESGTKRDMVALCMPDVPQYQKDILEEEGWIVRSVGPLPEACVGKLKFSRHFVKIQMWLLSNYRRIISIDSDALVLRNIDALFKCGEFCAAYRNSDLFNTGIVVLKPSVHTFNSMCGEIQRIGSYTGGDQGFLNYFYEDLKRAGMFSANTSENSAAKFLRLPSEYNGNVAIFYLLNKWRYIDTDEPYVVHYTLGPVKPWKWWSYPLFSLNWKWKSYRDRLPQRSGLHEPSLRDWNSWMPIPIFLALALMKLSKLCCRYCSHLTNSHKVIAVMESAIPVDGVVAKCFSPLLLAFASYYAFFHVPTIMPPLEAWTRFAIWALFFFALPYSVYCHIAFTMGAHKPLNTASVTVFRIAAECLLWFALSISVFYMQYYVPSLLLTTKRRLLTFVFLGVANFVLCSIFGWRLIKLSFQLGSSYSVPNFSHL